MNASSVKLPTWYRSLAVLVGLVSIALAFVVLLDPALGLATLVLLLGFALFIMGIDRVVAGVTGHPYGIMSGAGIGALKEVTGTAPALGQNPPGGSPPPK
ncbi:MAG: hypothetical protein WA547_04165 [Thermoplasmata archaeon]